MASIEISLSKIKDLQKQIEAMGSYLDSGLVVQLTNPQDGDLMVYEEASGKWVNGGGYSQGRRVQCL